MSTKTDKANAGMREYYAWWYAPFRDAPKPYYADESVVLYHGDCRKILPMLDGATFRAVITDPPYQTLDVEVSNGTTTRLVSRDQFSGERLAAPDGSCWFKTLSNDELISVLKTCEGMLSDDGAAYIFADVKTGLCIYPRLPVRNVIVWDKLKIGMGYAWRRMHEWVVYCPQAEHKLRNPAFGDIIRCAGVDKKFHPTEKPVGVVTPLILNSTDEGDCILDPFAGVGAVLLAARLSGRKAVGIEIDEAFCQATANRLRQGVLFGRAFP